MIDDDILNTGLRWLHAFLFHHLCFPVSPSKSKVQLFSDSRREGEADVWSTHPAGPSIVYWFGLMSRCLSAAPCFPLDTSVDEIIV